MASLGVPSLRGRLLVWLCAWAALLPAFNLAEDGSSGLLDDALPATRTGSGIVVGGGSEIGWDYGDNQMGLPPKAWGRISDVCTLGKQQSPINIVAKKVNKSLKKSQRESVRWAYKPTAGSIRNDGKSISIDISTNIRNEIVMDNGRRFQLTQYRFHSPAEHKVDGREYPAEMQMIHRDKKGKIVIVSILFVSTDAVSDNKFLAPLWPTMPKFGSLRGKLIRNINPMSGLPKSRSFFSYTGSLTTPPCQENVLWMVMQQASVISFAQLLKLRSALRLDSKNTLRNGNARPIMPTKARIFDSFVAKEQLKDTAPGCKASVAAAKKAKLAQEKLVKANKKAGTTTALITELKMESAQKARSMKREQAKTAALNQKHKKDLARITALRAAKKKAEHKARGLEKKAKKAAAKSALLSSKEVALKKELSTEVKKLRKATAKELNLAKKLGKSSKMVKKLKTDVRSTGGKLTNEKNSRKVDLAKAKKEEQKLRDSIKANKAVIKLKQVRIAAMRKKLSKHAERMKALKASTVAKKVHRADLNKMAVAHRKEVTAIKIANKEQIARLAAQQKVKAEKAAMVKVRERDTKIKTHLKGVTKAKLKAKEAEARANREKGRAKKAEANASASVAAAKKKADAKLAKVTGTLKKQVVGCNNKKKALQSKVQSLSKKLAKARTKIKMMKKMISLAKKGKIKSMRQLEKRLKGSMQKISKKALSHAQKLKQLKKAYAKLKAQYTKGKKAVSVLKAKLKKAKSLGKKFIVLSTKHKDAKKRIKRLQAKNKQLKSKKCKKASKCKTCRKCKKHGKCPKCKKTKCKTCRKCKKHGKCPKCKKTKCKKTKCKKTKCKKTTCKACKKSNGDAKWKKKAKSLQAQLKTMKAAWAAEKKKMQKQMAKLKKKEKKVIKTAKKKAKKKLKKEKKKAKKEKKKLKKVRKKARKAKRKAKKKIKKEKKKIKKEKKKIKKEEKKAAAKPAGCPRCKKCSKKRKVFKVGDKKYLYVKFKKKYLGCKVKSAFAIKNYERVKTLANKYKKEKWVCYNKWMKKKFGGGGGGPKPGKSKGKAKGKK